MPRRRAIPFFTDNDVADSVGEAILQAGHLLTRLRDVMLTDSPDPIVAAACRESGRVLVTHNYRDFRRIVQSVSVTRREIDRLCRVELVCSQVIAARRITEEMQHLEFEWARFLKVPDSPMRISIGDHSIRLGRGAPT